VSGKTTIEWTDASWNPIRGCSRVSEGCRNCYAEKIAARFSGAGQPYEGLAEMKVVQGPPVAPGEGRTGKSERTRTEKEARWTGTMKFIEEHLEDPLRWKHPRRVFVNSMSDLFHEGVPDSWLRKIYDVMLRSLRTTPHTFQILTKRPIRMQIFLQKIHPLQMDPHIWHGVSVEDQDTANVRIPMLMGADSAIRWISYEPALGPISIAHYLKVPGPGWPKIDWVVCGGESGTHARPMHPQWARSLRDQCQDAGVPFFFKQWGECAPGTEEIRKHSREGVLIQDTSGDPARDAVMMRVGKKIAGRLLDGREWNEYPR
jgi:protein gp37